jgi:hypothetical protein
MKFVTHKISTGPRKSFEQIVSDYAAKQQGTVKTASAGQTVKTAEGVARSDAKQEEGESSGQLDVEPLHQTGESTPKVKGKSGGEDKKDKAAATNQETKVADCGICDKDNENNDDADESGQTKADFPKLTNDPKAGKHRDGDGDQKKEANSANFGDKKAPPFGKKEEKKDGKDGKKEEKEGKEVVAKTAQSKRRFIRIANLDGKSKAWLKKYWGKIYMGEYADAMTADK